MSQELSTETYIMVVTGVGRVYLSASQAVTVSAAMDREDSVNIEIPDKGKFKISSIHALVKAGIIEETDKIKQGEFKCKFGTWHTRGKECNCAEGRRLGIL